MAMKTNFGQLLQGDSIEKGSSRTVTFSPKQSKVKGVQVKEVYPPIRFNSRTSMWGGIASNLIVGRESSAFKDELLQSHELFKGTFMRQNKRSFIKDDRDTNRKPWTWIVEQYENEQQEKRYAERHAWATASPAKSDQSGSKLDHTVSRFEPEAIKPLPRPDPANSSLISHTEYLPYRTWRSACRESVPCWPATTPETR